MNILIHIDGDNKIGMGHFFRALNLAKEFKKHKHQVIFLTKSKMVKKSLPKIFECKMIFKDSKEEKIIKGINPEIVIIDKLKEKTKLLRILKENSSKIFAIDYVGNNKDIIDFGINILYPLSGLKSEKSISGFKYAILNNSFKRTKPITISKKIKNILVTQGGSDTHCFTPQILETLKQFSNEVNISLVVGPSFECWNELEKSINKFERKIKVYHNVKDMAKIMKKHDVAITGGGMTLLELCCLGIPSIIICGEKFENETAKLISKQGFGINLGYKSPISKTKLAISVRQLLYDYDIRKKMNNVSKGIVDGKGSKLVVSEILSRVKK